MNYSYMLDNGQEIKDLGTVYPVKLKDVQKLSAYGWVVEKSKKSLNRVEDDTPLLHMLIEEDLTQEDDNKRGLFIYCLTEFIKLTTQCKDVKFLKETLSWIIEDENERFLNYSNFETFREVTAKQNLIFEKRFHKPMFQKAIDDALEAKRKKNKGVDIDTILEIVSLEMKMTPKKISEELSYVQLLALFQRIQLKESSRISVQYASSGNFQDVVIEDYAKDIDLYKHPEDELFKKKNTFGVEAFK